MFDSAEELQLKCAELAELLRSSRHAVFHTGAGVSTSAGIPDFRGPQGVWTLEQRKRKVEGGVSFAEAQPTPTHNAIQALVSRGMAQFVVSQNVDGLHLKSGLPRDRLAELHGNVLVERCERCIRCVGTSPSRWGCPYVAESSLSTDCCRSAWQTGDSIAGGRGRDREGLIDFGLGS